ncbi:MAG: 3-demethylubiquinone-9 3-O-methyltransferase [Ktedonobacteraceae bacterium]|nr:3-demethylubiquinone-9 3-O-methyltransferase [Ktedonobacteraceae bacterium]MBO0790514.1 3-demethylubiquinone-9 3-O-methyltransferase [Ktedonobacteraceae bacterium]
MAKSEGERKRSQEEIFNTYAWWDKGCALNLINTERCDYIESCIERVFGSHTLQQQEILEIGCGGGLICEELARRGATTIGIDISQAALNTAREHVQQIDLGHMAHFEHGAAEMLPYANGSFSVIACLDVLEHVRDLQATIREIARVLAPGGVFIFDTINRTLISRLALIWVGERLFRRNGLVPGLHDYRSFIKPHELQTQLSAYDLQVHEMVGFMPHLAGTRITLGPGWFKSVSYVGYATRGR